jgi:hypothetical protein
MTLTWARIHSERLLPGKKHKVREQFMNTAANICKYLQIFAIYMLIFKNLCAMLFKEAIRKARKT